jgi:pentatricopeptide repeat protein
MKELQIEIDLPSLKTVLACLQKDKEFDVMWKLCNQMKSRGIFDEDIVQTMIDLTGWTKRTKFIPSLLEELKLPQFSIFLSAFLAYARNADLENAIRTLLKIDTEIAWNPQNAITLLLRLTEIGLPKEVVSSWKELVKLLESQKSNLQLGKAEKTNMDKIVVTVLKSKLGQ